VSANPFAARVRAARRALRRLLDPDHEEDRARLARLERQQADQFTAMRADVERLSKQVGGLGIDKWVRSLDRRVEQIDERLVQFRESAWRHSRATSRALRDLGWDEEQRALERRATRRVERLARSGRPVVVGPWSGEVGFELLYWVPFVTWMLEQAKVSPDRVLVISRGGAGAWYQHLAGRYADILSQVTPEEFRARTELKKQRTIGAFDRAVLRRAMREADISGAVLVHPDLMYRLFYPFWKQQVSLRRVEGFTSYRLLSSPARPDLSVRLPREYVAVRFYFSDCFPDTVDNRTFVESVIRTLAESTDVVVLNTGLRLDDHSDHAASRSQRIHSIEDLMTPAGNLEVQTAVIAGARAFVGTYGGYAYLAPLLGINALAFYSVEDAFFAHHLELARRVFRRLGGGSLVPLDVRDEELLRLVFAERAIVPGAAHP
jgi:hypothetical protein